MLMPKLDYTKLGYWKNKNIYEYLQLAAENSPSMVAVIDNFRSYSYEELRERVQLLAGALLKMGIRKGDVVSYQLPNWGEAVIIHQATAMIGAISNPIIPIYRERESEYILKTSQSKIFFIPYQFRNYNYLEMVRSIKRNIPSLQQIVVLDSYLDFPALQTEEVLFSEFLGSGYYNQETANISETDPLLLLYTSGTTSNPKGVLHTHNTLIHENLSMVNLYELDCKDVIFMPSPVTHITGVICGLELPFLIEGRVVFQDIWEPKQAIQSLINEQCTWSLAATPFLRGILQNLNDSDSDRFNLKVFLCGGADIPPELIKEAREKLNCFSARMYGSSEIPSVSTCSYGDPLGKAACTDGRLLDGISVKIFGEGGEELSIGSVGELGVMGPEMFLGYIQGEYNSESFTKEGYFLTGDLAVMDKDGFIEIKGRKKDIIIRGGENISVKEVEDLLLTHPAIDQVAIVGMKDEAMGEKACAFVVLKPYASFSFDEMIRFLSTKGIAKQKFPEKLELMNIMPMTASGKIQKFKLRESLHENLKELG